MSAMFQNQPKNKFENRNDKMFIFSKKKKIYDIHNSNTVQYTVH